MMRRQSSVSLLLPAVALAALGALLGCGGPEYPNCNNDSHCHEGEFCVNGTCQQCRDNNDCPAGQQCNGGRCDPIQGWCGSDADCPGGQECQNNQCVASQVSQSEPMDTTPGPCTLGTVYFPYNSSDLEGSARNALESNARCIQERQIPQVRLTGHTDPRGTEEYNLALGDRRARTVKTFLTNLGVPARSVTTRSMGEEMASGSDESSWARDRRVEFEER
jgi:peptidoglycan-associated lipoprotein